MSNNDNDKLQEKINHFTYMDDIMVFANKEKEVETLIYSERIYNQEIGIKFRIKKMCHADNEKGDN